MRGASTPIDRVVIEAVTTRRWVQGVVFGLTGFLAASSYQRPLIGGMAVVAVAAVLGGVARVALPNRGACGVGGRRDLPATRRGVALPPRPSPPGPRCRRILEGVRPRSGRGSSARRPEGVARSNRRPHPRVDRAVRPLPGRSRRPLARCPHRGGEELRCGTGGAARSALGVPTRQTRPDEIGPSGSSWSRP